MAMADILRNLQGQQYRALPCQKGLTVVGQSRSTLPDSAVVHGANPLAVRQRELALLPLPILWDVDLQFFVHLSKCPPKTVLEERE